MKKLAKAGGDDMRRPCRHDDAALEGLPTSIKRKGGDCTAYCLRHARKRRGDTHTHTFGPPLAHLPWGQLSDLRGVRVLEPLHSDARGRLITQDEEAGCVCNQTKGHPGATKRLGHKVAATRRRMRSCWSWQAQQATEGVVRLPKVSSVADEL